MTNLLSVGQSANRAYGYAHGTVSENISNAQTDGYVRRSAKLSDTSGSGNMVFYKGAVGSGGVTVEGVTRKVEDWLVADARNASSTAQQADALSRWLTTAEASLADDEYGIGDAIDSVFTSADQLSTDVTDRTRRRDFLASIETVVDRISTAAERMASIKTGIQEEATQSVATVQQSLDALKSINFSLSRSRAGSSNAAALLDQRDRLLNTISEHVAIRTEVGFNGTVTVTTAGPSPQTLLDDSGAATIAFTVTGTGALQFTVDNGTPTAFTPEGGSLAGLSTASRIMTDRGTQLDDLADDFADLMNNFQTAGLDANGNAGIAMLDASGGAAGLVLTMSNPDLVAAANASSSNGNILDFGGDRVSNDASTSWNVIASAHAQATSSARQQAEITGKIRDDSFIARDEVSSVDLDQEAADLVRFQQAYQGAARILQVAREMMQTIFNSL